MCCQTGMIDIADFVKIADKYDLITIVVDVLETGNIEPLSQCKSKCIEAILNIDSFLSKCNLMYPIQGNTKLMP